MAESIVITGWGMVTPLGADAASTWSGLMEGRTGWADLDGPEWKAFDHPRAAQALEAWVPQNLLRRDRSIQLGALAAQEAWKSGDLYRIPPDRIGTTFSSSKGGLVRLLEAGKGDPAGWVFLEDFFPHAVGQLLGTRFGFSGPSTCYASACSTGLVSIAQGARLLVDGDCDAVLAGSTEASIHPLVFAGFRNMGLFSEKEGGPSPFDSERDGFLMGEGAGALVLETAKSARHRGKEPLARVTGWALAADAHGPLEMKEDGSTIVHLIKKAMDRAGLGPSQIGYVNAHGTGTRLNDQVEANALKEVFGLEGAYVSSTKGATGHLLGAAGSVEAILAGMALVKGELPETRNLTEPDPECGVRHVEKGGMRKKVEHVMSLSYGFGGQLGAVIFSKA